MSWEPLKQSLAVFDDVVRQLRVRIADDAPVFPQLDLVRRFLADHTELGEDELLEKWNGEDFKEFHDAAIVVRRLTDAVVALQNQSEGELRRRLKQVLSGPLTQDFVPEQSKDFFYELEIAHLLLQAGFDVSLREPDIVVSGNGLDAPLGLACKYPSSESQIHAHLSKGYKQIANQNLEGCVVIGLDLIVFKTVFDSPPKYLDFREGDRHPLDVANGCVSDAVKHLVVQRSEDYPSERPMDGAILTLSMWGAYGKPAGLTCVTAWAVQCDAANPRFNDIGRLVKAAQQVS
ncbi:MAG: hypothetical protein WD534_12785 [Phycisphaeraceae bacterium]